MPSHLGMFSFLVIALLFASCLAEAEIPHYSFSRTVGGGSGTSFSTEGQGKITAIRLWEHNNAYIAGLQVRYGYIWSALVGRRVGSAQELDLYENEAIVQVSGKYDTSYIYQLRLVTSRGRCLIAGQPIRLSFNMYSAHPEAELIMLSGRSNGAGITSLGAHWGVPDMYQSNSTSRN